MGEEKLIQVSFQIPPSALDSISRLAQQLRLLTEAAGTQSASVGRTLESERMESGSFDPERFYELQRGMRGPQAVRRTVPDIADAPVVSPEVSAEGSRTADAAAVSAGVQSELENAKGAGDEPSQQPMHSDQPSEPGSGPQYTLPEERGDPLPPAREPQADRIGGISAVRADAGEYVPDAPAVRWDAGEQVPDVESARAEAEARELTLAAVQGEVNGGIEAPVGAGVVVQTQPGVPQSRWSDVTEELVIPGPAPLTAEAVSLAFERDGRRYDNGFPLY